ncbi:MAG: ATP-binding protein [Clostridium sp.]|uniref:two-component system histidine kinase PnpS n=1 Tax=Clostridium sp. TaxID=1506 RepID=UPI002FC769F1
MRKKLFALFMITIILTVGITGFILYGYTKHAILETNKEALQSEVYITSEYIKEINIDNFSQIAKTINSKINRRITIVSKTGIVVGDSSVDFGSLDNHKDRKEIREAFKTGSSYVVRYSKTAKTDMCYYAKKVILDGEEYVIRLAVKLDAIKDLQSSYYKIILFTIIVGIIVSSVFMYIYISIITKPITRLKEMAETISKGNYNRRIKLRSKDEIGKLASSFNLMAQSLEDTIANLTDKQGKLVSILSNSEDGIIVIDDSSRILMINPAAQTLFNLDETIIGKYFIEVIRNHDIEKIIRDMPSGEEEITITYPEVRYLKIRATNAISYENGKEVIGVLIMVQDITKVKKLEQMRSDFVANVSHELKTPLTSIKGFAETLKHVEDKPTHDRFLDIINIEADRLTRLINDVLVLSEIENKDNINHDALINVKEASREVYDITKAIADKKNITLDFICSIKDECIVGNRDKFKQMLINVIENGIKYTNDGGFVYIYLMKSGNNIVIKVKDNGIGIEKEHIERLFERFYRVDKDRSRTSGGTGLGLAIVKHIVMLFDGKIRVKSLVGRGTTFTITLPLVNEKLT